MENNLKKYINKLSKNCDVIQSIQNINDMYNYEDNISGGSTLEWDLISCGQDGSENGYNELQRFYNIHISKELKDNYNIDVLKALCECCKEINHNLRTHDKFKECIDKKLALFKVLLRVKSK